MGLSDARRRLDPFGLPVVLVVVAIISLIRARARKEANSSMESRCTVRRIGLIHCALAVQALIFLVQELLTIRTMGIPESHISLVVGLITTVVNPVLRRGCYASVRSSVAWHWPGTRFCHSSPWWRWSGCTITASRSIWFDGPSK